MFATPLFANIHVLVADSGRSDQQNCQSQWLTAWSSCLIPLGTGCIIIKVGCGEFLPGEVMQMNGSTSFLYTKPFAYAPAA